MLPLDQQQTTRLQVRRCSKFSRIADLTTVEVYENSEVLDLDCGRALAGRV